MSTLKLTAMHAPAAAAATATAGKPTVAFTTPANYATRLSHLLTLNSFTPLWIPTILTHITPQNLTSLSLHLSPSCFSQLSAIAFPSRTAISAVSAALRLSLTPPTSHPLLPPDADTFIVAALGKDSELIDSQFLQRLCPNLEKIRVLVPPTATPSGLVAVLGEGGGRRVLCPVPAVVGLSEPPVVPDFLRELEAAGWIPVRVEGYETMWAGPTCAEGIVRREEGLDAVVFTSSAEVEGLLKGLMELGWDWERVRRRWPGLVVAAHGPVTAKGAERMGVEVDVVSGRFSSFEGVVEALNFKLRGGLGSF